MHTPLLCSCHYVGINCVILYQLNEVTSPEVIEQTFYQTFGNPSVLKCS